MKRDKTKVVVLKSFNSIEQAQMAKALLESADVEVRLQNELVAQLLPFGNNFMQVNLLTREEDVERAKSVLSAGFDEKELEKEALEALKENPINFKEQQSSGGVEAAKKRGESPQQRGESPLIVAQKREMDRSRVVVLKGFNSIEQAQMAKVLLESAGVEVRLQNELAAQVLPIYGSWMQVNLLVRESDLKKASEVLTAKFDVAEFEAEESEAERECEEKHFCEQYKREAEV